MADSLADKLKSNKVEFDRAVLGFRIPEGTTLARPVELDSIQSPTGTEVDLVLEKESIRCTFSPALKILTKEWYAENVFWDSIQFTFPKFQKGSDAFVIGLRQDAAALQFDATDKVRAGIVKAFNELISGTRLSNATFSPLDDPEPQGALKELEAKFASSKTPTSAKFPTSQFNSFFMSVTIRSTESISRVDPKVGGLVIAANKPITIRASFPQSGEVIEKWFKDKSAPLPELDSVTLTSDAALTVQQRQPDGRMEDVIRLQEIRLTKGPQVTVRKIELLGSLKGKAGTEQGFLALFVVTLRMAEFGSAGVDSETALRLAIAKTAMDAPDAVIVPGLTRRKIEEALNSQVTLALQQFFADHFDVITAAIPNYSHARIFGMPLNRSEMPANRCE